MNNSRIVDRTGWPSGPWDNEPDRLDFEHAGLPCLLNRGSLGVWCGYAAVPPGHPLHGKSCDDVDVDVHGGLTYANQCDGEICHIPKPGEPDNVWWFGFDCAHCDDTAPRLLAHMPSSIFPRSAYRDLAYARHETEQLAEQLVQYLKKG